MDQFAALRKALEDTEPDPELRKAHREGGCFTDMPRGTLCMVCGAPLKAEPHTGRDA